MESHVGFDALNGSKSGRRSSTDTESVESSAREDDLVEEIDTSATDLGMRPWKLMSGRRGKIGTVPKSNSTNLIRKPKSSCCALDSREKEYSIVAPKRVGNENGKSAIIISPDVGNSFQRSVTRLKGKEVESKGNHRQNFPVIGPSISNRSVMRQPDEMASSSKKDKEVSSHLDVDLKHRTKGNGVVGFCGPQGEVDEVLPKSSYLYSSGKITGRSKGSSQENVEKIVYVDRSDGVSYHEFKSNHLHSEPDHSYKKKGKMNLEDQTLKDMLHGGPTNQSNRAASLFGKVLTVAEEQGSFGSFQKQITTKDRISNPHHDQACLDPVVSRRNHSLKKYVKGRKKCKSLPGNFREASGFILNQASCLQSHAGTSNLKLYMGNENRCHGTTSTEIDKLYPEARSCNSHGQQSGVSYNSSARASQIESDEMFARELQEQFYHEATKFMDMEKEVEAAIAWSFLQNEDEHEDAASLAQKLHSKSAFLDEIKRKLVCEMDLEKRLDLLEAIEDLIERNDTLEHDDLAFNHSFNGSDDGMQLEFDQSNDGTVGSSEINNLPLSLIQNDYNKEACAVCLEIPSVGETMRHLPCLHKFHKMCIDTWLKKKPSCPVCKFKITRN